MFYENNSINIRSIEKSELLSIKIDININLNNLFFKTCDSNSWEIITFSHSDGLMRYINIHESGKVNLISVINMTGLINLSMIKCESADKFKLFQ